MCVCVRKRERGTRSAGVAAAAADDDITLMTIVHGRPLLTDASDSFLLVQNIEGVNIKGAMIKRCFPGLASQSADAPAENGRALEEIDKERNGNCHNVTAHDAESGEGEAQKEREREKETPTDQGQMLMLLLSY